jgi:hypothetical protein
MKWFVFLKLVINMLKILGYGFSSLFVFGFKTVRTAETGGRDW